MQFNDVQLRYGLLNEEINTAVRGVLTSGRYILGPAVHRFEEEFAAYCRADQGVGVASGTSAIAIGLRAVGVRPGDHVLIPAISAAATAMAVTSTGARPIFVDVSPDDFSMSPEDCFQKRTSRAKAVVPVHLYGMPARLKEISKTGLALIEDAAQAHGSDASWGRCGSFGLASAFSFYPTKNLGTYGDGGMIVTSHAEIAEKARLLRNYGQREAYSSEVLGDNSRLDEIHAAILRVQLRKLDEWNRRRRAIAAMYRGAFRELPLGMQSETGKSNYHLFVVTTPQRDKLRAYLAENDIPTLIHYPVPLHRQPAFAEFDPGRCPNADQICSRVLSLPMHAFLTDAETQQIIEAVRGFFNRRT